MKVVLVGDSPTVATGFSRCVKAAADELHAAGHETHILGMSYFGDPHEFPYTIWPCIQPLDKCRDAFGTVRLPLLIDRLKPDVVVLLNDPWNVKGYFDVLDSYFKDAKYLVPPVVGWLAVDSLNHFAKPLNRLAHVAIWTKFGGDVLRTGGYDGPLSIVPLGVDPHFYPRNKAEARAKMGIDEGAYVVGVVGRNQTRKRLDCTLEYFAKWVNEYSLPANVQLLIHTAPTGDAGCNIRAVAHHYGLTGNGRLSLSEPNIGKGVEDQLLPYLYGAMDCYWTTSQAEGWGLPALEAMACGVPCILPNFASFGDDGWVGDAAIRVPCTSSALTAPMNAQPYTIGAVPDRAATVVSLHELYTSLHTRGVLRERGLARAAEFSWERTGVAMVELLESVVSVHQPHQGEGVNEAALVDGGTAAEVQSVAAESVDSVR
jgi:D-inositol-3-phosphate glycosyltransferase